MSKMSLELGQMVKNSGSKLKPFLKFVEDIDFRAKWHFDEILREIKKKVLRCKN